MGKIITKNGLFSFEEIKNNTPLLNHDYEQDTLKFCQDWLNGKEKFILHTSGSTGTPKSIGLSRRQMEASALTTVSALGLKSGDTALVCLNTRYIAGIMMLVRALVVDMDLLLVPPGSSPLQEIAENTKIDFVALVPIQLQSILEVNNSKDLKILNLMKAIIIGGAPVTSALETKIQQITAPVFSTYGMTETVSHIALRKLNGKKNQDYFQALTNVLLGTDERGCLKIKAEMTNNEWLQTNDLVTLLENDKFRWLGRADTIINTGGVKVQPEKIERALETILTKNGIKDYFIAGLPHSQLGEAVTLFVEKNEESSLSLEKLRSLLDKFETPKAIIHVRSFPRSLTGKIDKKKIVDSYKDYY